MGGGFLSELLYHGGLAVIVVALTAALIIGISLGVAKLRLNRQMDAEYGERRH